MGRVDNPRARSALSAFLTKITRPETTSGSDPVSVATSVLPRAQLSTAVKPKPSDSDGTTTASAQLI